MTFSKHHSGLTPLLVNFALPPLPEPAITQRHRKGKPNYDKHRDYFADSPKQELSVRRLTPKHGK